MVDIRKLLNQITIAESQLQFLAPCIKNGRIRTRVAGMIHTFIPKPQFEGWGIFQSQNDRIAALIEVADIAEISTYLQQFQTIRLRLAYRLRNQSWLAYPVNEAEMQHRFKIAKPVLVHLVTEGIAFEQIVSRWDGSACWFETIDRRSDPTIAETLQSHLKQLTPVKALQFKGMTPEMRSLYQLVAQQTQGFPQSDELRLQQALKLGGGALQQFQDQGNYWTVNWTTADGTQHTSAIAKSDLTVISSGICLSGRDRDFDLQSLVGVIEQE